MPLDQAVRDLVEERCGRRPAGPIRLLTQLQYFGYTFNPVSFYYCFDANDEEVDVIVAEVTNTPWGERHCYVLPQEQSRSAGRVYRHAADKEMHVSPFMPMDMQYDFRFGEPGDALTVHMENARQGKKVFDATLILQREKITGGSLARVLLTYPMMTLQIVAAIHWQALKLWLKGAPVYDHPAKNGALMEETR